jgi:hypothetical protein
MKTSTSLAVAAALSVGAAYWIYEDSQDDDDPAPFVPA